MKRQGDVALICLLGSALLGCAGHGKRAQGPITDGGEQGDGQDAGAEDAGNEDAGAGFDLTELVDRAREAHGVPALAALAFNAQGTLAEAVSGVRKSGDPTPATLTDQWHLGSDTKAMTATLVALQVESGALTWDTTLGEALPALSAAMNATSRAVTLRQLATMRGGFHDDDPAYEALPDMPDFPSLSVREQRRALTGATLSLAPAEAPGTAFHYANLSYIMLGAVLEEASDMAWEDLMRARLFAPLGMDDCGFGPPASPGKVDQPWAHTRSGDTLTPVAPDAPGGDNPPLLGPAGTVHCSLASWAKFGRAHLVSDTALLPASAYATLHTPVDSPEQYAMGWGAVSTRLGSLLSHDGSNTLNYARIVLNTTTGIGFVLTTNEGSADHAVPAIQELTDALLLHAWP